MARWLQMLFVPVVVIGCTGTGHRPVSPTKGPKNPSSAPASLPVLRLPNQLVPTHNRVHLKIDPSQPNFRGEIRIFANITRVAETVWLHAQGLDIDRARLHKDGQTVPLKLHPHPPFLGLSTTDRISPGPVEIHIEYQGPISDHDLRGIYRQKQRGRWYVHSQLGLLYARRAFPCFDEPSNKVPWTLTLEIPDGQKAFANTPIAARKKTPRGTTLVHFEKTRPLSSYLIAFAVGPFETIEAGTTRNGKPLRIVVPQGRAKEAQYAVNHVGPVLARIEDYFGIPLPYPKLDIIAAPATAFFGAMENPGLITMRETSVLAEPSTQSDQHKKDLIATMAHEISHHWFGDLVTLAWWDDLWLNEGFAVWLGQKIAHQYRPAWQGNVDFIIHRGQAAFADGFATARSVRQKIKSEDDVASAFGNITYRKAPTLIHMFESWLGPKVFQTGVQRYIEAHADQLATSDDFLSAMDRAANREVKPAFSSFLNQNGIPLISFDLVCDEDQPPRLELRQQRYRALGVHASEPSHWQIPVCVKFLSQDKMHRTCDILKTDRGTLVLKNANRCPTWVMPNESGLGYYRSQSSPDLTERLFIRGMPHLTPPERLAMFDDIQALVESGHLDVGAGLRFASRFAEEPNSEVIIQITRFLRFVASIVPSSLEPQYAAHVRKLFGQRARQVGWLPRPNEPLEHVRLRAHLVPMVALQGRDEMLGTQARKIVEDWLLGLPVEPDIVDATLATAAFFGDDALWTKLHDRAKNMEVHGPQKRLLRALMSFSDPELGERSLNLVLDNTFDGGMTAELLYERIRDPRLAPSTYAWVKKHYDSLVGRMPEKLAVYLPFTGSVTCEPQIRKELDQTFKTRTELMEGGPVIYTQLVERLDACLARRQAQLPSLRRFLRAGQGPSKNR